MSFLSDNLGLTVNPKNDVVVAALDGLHFLGHRVSGNKAVVDRLTTDRILSKITTRNIASYRALYLENDIRKRLDWILLEKYVDIW